MGPHDLKMMLPPVYFNVSSNLLFMISSKNLNVFFYLPHMPIKKILFIKKTISYGKIGHESTQNYIKVQSFLISKYLVFCVWDPAVY